MQDTVILQEGREKSLLRHHPWVFSKAVYKEDLNLKPGSTVKVLSFKGDFLCYGLYSPKSQIRIRALSFDEKVMIDEKLISERIFTAHKLRERLIARGNDGVRLVSSEGDLLPGLIADKYNDFIVISISSCGMERFRKVIIDALQALYPEASIPCLRICGSP